MSTFTLDEAADWLTRRLGGAEVLGAPVTPRQILQYGIHGHLLICIAMAGKCYSPTIGARQRSHDYASPQEAVDAATVDLLGLYMVPVRTLFAFETADVVPLEGVWSLDGEDMFKSFETVTRDRLRVMSEHLSEFAAGLQLSVEQPGNEIKQWTEAKIQTLRDALDAGETQTSLAKKHGITRQRVAELVRPREAATPSANNPFPSTKAKRKK